MAEEFIPEYQSILNQAADAPRNYPIPRKIGRKNLEQAFLTAFELVGGVPRLALWADSNPTQFYSLLSKLFPQHVEAKLGADESLAAILTKMGSGHVYNNEGAEDVQEQSPLPAPDAEANPLSEVSGTALLAQRQSSEVPTLKEMGSAPIEGATDTMVHTHT